MSKIIELNAPRAPIPELSVSDKLNARFGDDDWLLKLCADWRAARAQMQKNWAEHDLATGWGTLPDKGIELDTTPLDRMKTIEFHLSKAQPRTMLLARQLLRVCVTILAHEHPEDTLAQGPLLEIIRNVIRKARC